MTTEPPAPDHRSALLALAGAVFFSALDQTIVSTALPQIAAELGAVDDYDGVFSAYLLATLLAIPVSGRVGDRVGRRQMLLVGMALFVIGSVGAALAPGMAALIGARAVQGLGGGVLLTNAYAAVAELFGLERSARYAGLLSGLYGIAGLIGPVVGGALTEHAGWRWIFWINLPLGLGLMLHMARALPAGEADDEGVFDRAGLGALALTLALFALAGTRGTPLPWLASAGGVLALVWIERRAVDPLLPVRLLADRAVSTALGSMLLINGALYAAAIYVPLRLQGPMGLDPTAAGFAMLPLVVGLVGGAMLGGRRVSLTGRYRGVSAVGALIAAVGLGMLAALPADGATVWVLLPLAVIGLGLGLPLPGLMVAVQNALPPRDLGTGTAAVRFTRALGGLAGVAGFGLLLDPDGAALALVEAGRAVDHILWGSAALCLVGAALAAAQPERRLRGP